MRLIGFSVLAAAAALAVSPAAAIEIPKFGMPSWFGGGDRKDAPPTPGATTDCPLIVIEPGSEMIRVPPEAEAAAVKHQLSIKTTARECIVEGDHLNIKVGVEGDAMLGPTGSPGTYGATVKVALRRTKDDSVISSKSYRVNPVIPPGAARAEFRFLADPFTAPTVAKAQEDYEIVIGFSEGGGADAAGDKPAPKRKKGRR